MALSACCWMALLRKLDFPFKFSLFFASSLMLIEPFMSAANQTRPDALCFLMVSSGLLCFVYCKYVLAGFLVVVAFEIHPVGASAIALMASVLLAKPDVCAQIKRDLFPMMLWFLLGISIGVLYYLLLHRENITLTLTLMRQLNHNWIDVKVNNFLYVYFFETRYLRHVPECVVIVVCTLYFIAKGYYKENRLILTMVIMSFLFSLTIGRPNPFYMIYVYPSFLLLVLWVFHRHGRLNFAVCLLLLYLLPQYAVVYKQNRDWNLQEYLTQVRSICPEDDSMVIGTGKNWYAFPDRPFAALRYTTDLTEVLPAKLFQLRRNISGFTVIPTIRLT
jgi:hypothetical protein